MNDDKVTARFLSDNSYIWLAAKSLVSYLGYRDMTEFLAQNYYFKANLSQGRVVDHAGGRLDYNACPETYADFIPALMEELFPGGDTEALRRDLDRSYLLSRLSGQSSFLSRDYSLFSEDRRTRKLTACAQIYRDGEDIFAAVLIVDLTALYRKGAEKRDRSEFDTLTGTFSRAYGERVSRERLEYHPDDVAVVISARVRDFSAINTDYGQRGGSLVLVDAAIRLTGALSKNAIITRTGPEEYIALVGHSGAEKAEAALEKLVSEEFTASDGEREIPYRLAAGYAVFPEESRDFSQLCRMAELAAAAAGSEGGPAFARYRREMVLREHESVGFNMMELANNIPSAILVYRAGGDEEILYANNETLRLFECDSSDDFMEHVGGVWKGFVYHEDYERVQREIRMQQDEAGNVNRTDYLTFRIVTQNGVLRTVEDIGRLVDSPYYGKIYYVFLHDVGEKDDLLRRAFQ